MNAFDIIVIVTVSVAVAAIIGWMIYKKVKHKGSCTDCGCGCSACPHNRDCDSKKKQ